MQPTLCSRCHKNVAVIFVTKIENGESHNEGLCLKCAKEMGLKPVEEDVYKRQVLVFGVLMCVGIWAMRHFGL